MSEDNEVQVGEAPNEEEQFYVQWGQESLKSEMDGMHDTLKQLVTLSTALAGSAIIFTTDLIFMPMKIFAIISFVTCLAVSFSGMLPFEAKVDLQCPYEIKRMREEAAAWKLQKLKLAFFFLAAGLVIAGAGLLLGWGMSGGAPAK